MQSLAFAVLLRPDRTVASVEALTSCWVGARREAFQDARRRAGIVRESVRIQPAPGRDLAIVHLEADDLDIALTIMGTSAEPFDCWFRDAVRDIHGVALAEGFRAPDLVLDFDANRT
jgi:hypothetical protein